MAGGLGGAGSGGVPAAEHWIDQENPTHDLRWDDAGCSRLFDGFLRACRAVGMEHLVAPLRLPSSIAGRVLAHHGLSFDVIYLDGSHEAGDVFTDCRLFWPMCRGILVGDDWHDERFSVGRGVIRFLEVEGIPFHRLQLADGFWAVARGEEDGFNGSRPPAAIAVGCAVWF